MSAAATARWSNNYYKNVKKTAVYTSVNGDMQCVTRRKQQKIIKVDITYQHIA